MRKFFTDLSSRVANHRDHWWSRAHRRAVLSRIHGSERLLSARLTGLETTKGLVERVPLTGPLASLLASRIDTALDTGFADFDALTAKDLAKQIRDIEDPARLQRIVAAEEANKARKTVLTAARKQLDRLVPEIVELDRAEPQTAAA